MTTPLRLLRLSLHVSGEPGRPRVAPRVIGTLSQFGDIARVTFDEGYIRDPARPTLSLCYRGEGETETRGILGADRDARLVRHDRHLPVFFQNLLPEGPNRDRLARVRGCSPDDEFELLAAAGHDLMGALQVDLAPLDDATARLRLITHPQPLTRKAAAAPRRRFQRLQARVGPVYASPPVRGRRPSATRY